MQAHIDSGCKWFRSRVSKILEYNHDIRFDHGRGPFQTFTVPWEPQQNHRFLDISEEETLRRTAGRLPRFIPDPGQDRFQNQFNSDLGKLFFSHLISECSSKGARIFAEDGGVGRFDYIHEALKDLNIPGMMFIGTEKKWDSQEYIEPSTLPEQMVAYFANHDYPALKDKIEQLIQNRGTEEGKQELSRFLKLAGREPQSSLEQFDPTVQTELIDQMLKSPANNVIFNVLDVLLKNGSLNDWRYRLDKPLYKYEENQEVGALLDHISVSVVIYNRI